MSSKFNTSNPDKFNLMRIRLNGSMEDELELINRLVTNITIDEADIRNDISRRIGKAISQEEREYLEDSAPDMIYDAKRAIIEMKKLAIVGIYRHIEINQSRIMQILFPASANPKWKPGLWHKYFHVRTELLTAGINIDKIPYHPSFNELRCLNNSIKHNDRVNDELAKFKSWKNKPLIDDKIDAAYIRLSKTAPKYLEALATRAMAAYKTRRRLGII